MQNNNHSNNRQRPKEPNEAMKTTDYNYFDKMLPTENRYLLPELLPFPFSSDLS